MKQPAVLTELIDRFERLPGVGPKTALRFALAVMRFAPAERTAWSELFIRLNSLTTTCATCFGIADKSPCGICSDGQRDKNIICVVAEPQDLLAIERTGAFRGLYHVLGGLISPIDGVGPDQLKIAALEARLPVQELILAFDPSIDGEATGAYLADRLKPKVAKISRLARGLPMGSDLEYADEVTLSDALTGRQSFRSAPR